jgi:Tol biopolymer transport system component/DNA-binding winged helix-turn-helix (wHTH) protein
MPSEVHSYQFDTVIVDVRAGRVTNGGQLVDLEPKAYDLLLLLLSRPGELVTKQDLLDAVWPGVFVTDNAIARVVAQLRRALGDSARQARYIETVPTRGYRFVAPVQLVRTARRDESQDVARATAPGPVDEMPLPSTTGHEGLPGRPASSGAPSAPHRRAQLVAIALGIVAAAALGLAWWSQQQVGRARPLVAPMELVQLTSSPSLDAFPAWSPDGQTLAYSSDRSGTFEIHLLPLAPGGRRAALTSDGQRNVQPDWSPDGTHVAYHSVRRGGIWVRRIDGGDARQVSPFGSRPTWSPDGRQIAFQAAPYTEPNGGAFEMFGPSSLWVVPVEGGVARQVTQPWQPEGGHVRPSWFPDNLHLLFASQGIRTTRLYKVHIQTGETTLLLDAGTRVLDPTLSRDGRTAYFVRMDDHLELWRLPLTATQTVAAPPVLVMPPGGLDVRHVSVHPDGRQLVYTGMSTVSGLRALPLNRQGLPSGPSVRLAEDAARAARRPSIAPDASAVVFERLTAGRPPSLWWLPLSGGPASQLTPADMSAVEPSWSADGTEVHFVSDHGNIDRIWSVSVANGTVRPVTALGPHPSGILRPRLSPDRHWLAYTTASGGVLDVRVRPVSGGEERVVARLGTGAAFPVWSPDSRALAFDAWTDGASRSFVIPLDGGTPVPVSPDVDQTWVRSWSPDGQRVAFAALHNGRWNVWWGMSDGSRQQRLTDYTDEHHYVRSPEWSPHGDRLIYEFATVSGNVWLVRPGSETVTAPE